MSEFGGLWKPQITQHALKVSRVFMLLKLDKDRKGAILLVIDSPHMLHHCVHEDFLLLFSDLFENSSDKLP